MSKIIGILSWFDESPTWLSATVASLARICDHVIAVDGRYLHYDDTRVSSSMAEHDAILQTARGAGIGLTLDIPTQPWATEMDKRTRAFQLAELVADVHRDWFIVLDGDEVLTHTPAKHDTIAELDKAATAGVRTVTVTLRDIADPHYDAQRTRFGMDLDVEHVIDCRVPRLFRFPKNLRVVGYHYNYVGDDENGDPVELWGHDGATQHRTPWACFTTDVVIEHRHGQRPKVRQKRRSQYYNDRDECRLETTDTLDKLEQEGATA